MSLQHRFPTAGISLADERREIKAGEVRRRRRERSFLAAAQQTVDSDISWVPEHVSLSGGMQTADFLLFVTVRYSLLVYV